MRVEEQITKKLRQAFAPVALEVVNDSHRHAGHAGSPETGESHFTIKVVSDSFAGKSRVERHRMVNEVLAEELARTGSMRSPSARSRPEERSRPL